MYEYGSIMVKFQFQKTACHTNQIANLSPFRSKVKEGASLKIW